MDSTQKNAILRLDLMAEENGLPTYSELVAALRDSDDLVPRISEDDPIAPALAEWLRGVSAILAKLPEGR